MLYGLCRLSNSIYVISAWQRYLCSLPLNPFCLPVYSLSPSLAIYEALEKAESVRAWASTAASWCRSADRQKKETEREEEEDTERPKRGYMIVYVEHAGERVREREEGKSESGRQRVFCVCSCSADRGNRAECALCVRFYKCKKTKQHRKNPPTEN